MRGKACREEGRMDERIKEKRNEGGEESPAVDQRVLNQQLHPTCQSSAPALFVERFFWREFIWVSLTEFLSASVPKLSQVIFTQTITFILFHSFYFESWYDPDSQCMLTLLDASSPSINCFCLRHLLVSWPPHCLGSPLIRFSYTTPTQWMAMWLLVYQLNQRRRGASCCLGGRK